MELELEQEAVDLFDELKREEKDNAIVQRLISDISMQYNDTEAVVRLVNDAFQILYDPTIEALPESYLIFSVICRWLTRFYCKRLMQLLTPEGLAVHFSQIPESLRKCYIQHQEHFSLRQLIEDHQRKLQTLKRLVLYLLQNL